ncbi:hypothetical protein [Armatimonas sp.]|uniref:hypothetical protein n=1 Tax=Armatimonas sp. TaxID=1872638 RepID=UPI0037510DDA
MAIGQRFLFGCVGVPILLIAGCVGKMALDKALYELPGEVLRSSVPPTQKLDSATQVAEALDAYVQPRFEILRDKNFGAIRIVYRKHAGIVQLKVDSDAEKTQLANINATGRDYAIGLFHGAPKPNRTHASERLELLYFNQNQLVKDWDHVMMTENTEKLLKTNRLDFEALEKTAQDEIQTLLSGKEKRTQQGEWTVLMRPVLAAKPECLSCHTGAKLNATLGVMVYAVRNSCPMGHDGSKDRCLPVPRYNCVWALPMMARSYEH